MGDLKQKPGETIFWGCLQQFVSKFADEYSRTVMSMTPIQKQFLMEILVDFTTQYQPPHRVKRQATMIVRREIRMLSPGERRDYFRAINMLKMNTSLPPNMYDFMANFHTGANIRRAHRGPGFPGWHRVYLALYEFFLRQQVPSVTIPYWASVLDNEMADPRQSVIWTAAFMGDGVGRPRPDPDSGPFFNWTRINPVSVFDRNIGFGPLYTWQDIREILRRTNNSQILLPTADENADFEGIHGGPHVFVGGSMSRLNTAARDPIFFMHHAFVDMIWQEFRYRQLRNRINPANDYPYNASDNSQRLHAPNATMGFGLNIQQRMGYSLLFDRSIRYAALPSCTLTRADCNSIYLFCNTANVPRCVGRTANDVPEVNYVNDVKPPEETDLSSVQRPSSTPSVRAGTQQQNPSPRRSRERSPRLGGRLSRTRSQSSNTCLAPKLVNDFISRESLNGDKTHREEWVKLPVRVISKRPPQYGDFSDYSLYSYTPRERQSIGEKRAFTVPGQQRSYRECQKRLQSVGTIKLVSYGLNYDGSAEEYALCDNRLGISQTTSFIAVKRPKQGVPSDAIVAAFDSCGRVCKPYCLKRAQAQSTASSNEMMAGGIRVTTETPLQFGETFAEATLSSWQITNTKSCPAFDQNNAPITFYCDYNEDWFWPGDQEQIITASQTETRDKSLPKQFRNQSELGDPSPERELVRHRLRKSKMWRNTPKVCRLNSFCTIPGPCKPCERGRTYRCTNRRYIAACRRLTSAFVVYQLG